MNFSIQIVVESGLVPLVVGSNARNIINLVLERMRSYGDRGGQINQLDPIRIF